MLDIITGSIIRMLPTTRHLSDMPLSSRAYTTCLQQEMAHSEKQQYEVDVLKSSQKECVNRLKAIPESVRL